MAVFIGHNTTITHNWPTCSMPRGTEQVVAQYDLLNTRTYGIEQVSRLFLEWMVANTTIKAL